MHLPCTNAAFSLAWPKSCRTRRWCCWRGRAKRARPRWCARSPIATRFGNLLETFVHGELLKHATTAETNARLLYYRDADRVDVDVVLENPAGQIVAVEVKAAATVNPGDLRGLKKLAHLAGESFKLGVLLYDGEQILPLGDRLWAAPVSSLWGR